jgi:hypothetical protein
MSYKQISTLKKICFVNASILSIIFFSPFQSLAKVDRLNLVADNKCGGNITPILIDNAEYLKPNLPGKMRSELGEIEYSKLIAKAIKYIEVLPEDWTLLFPAGTNSPIKIVKEKQPSSNSNSNYDYIGFVNSQGQPRDFLAIDMLDLIDTFNREPENDNKPLTGTKKTPTFHIVFRHRLTCRKYLVRNVNAHAVYRDVLNAILTGQLISTSINSNVHVSSNLRGKTRSELGETKYFELILKARQSMKNLPPDTKVSFPIGTNNPIKIGTGGKSPTDYNAIGFVNHQGKPRPILVSDLNAMFNGELKNRGKPKNSSNKVGDKKVLTIDLIVQNVKDKQIYSVKNINFDAVTRDVINAALNQKIIKIDIDIDRMEIKQRQTVDI